MTITVEDARTHLSLHEHGVHFLSSEFSKIEFSVTLEVKMTCENEMCK